MKLEEMLECIHNDELNPDNLTDLDEITEWIDRQISSEQISRAIIDFMTLDDLKAEIIRSPAKRLLAYKLLVIHFIYMVRRNEDVILDVLNLDED